MEGKGEWGKVKAGRGGEGTEAVSLLGGLGFLGKGFDGVVRGGRLE